MNAKNKLTQQEEINMHDKTKKEAIFKQYRNACPKNKNRGKNRPWPILNQPQATHFEQTGRKMTKNITTTSASQNKKINFFLSIEKPPNIFLFLSYLSIYFFSLPPFMI